MSMRIVASLGVALALAGCTPAPEATGSPEAVYRKFMLANLTGSEAALRPYIVDQPGAEVLWLGPYPPEVAKPMGEQFRTMEIVRVAEGPKKVTLTSSAAPLPLDVVFDGKRWRVDPAPIIAFRKRASGLVKP